ncbi:MAG TPA: toll/interleukin-1 receptor domain-containing protein [Verrucomicrobiae bacterium]|nr:toll/interleukin-1 receptor domain-containing protein [Verrucomicrobiae bacterium]
MNVFISYSVSDTQLVRTVADHIKAKANVTYWDQSKEPGKETWPTIFSWIDAAELVLVLITENTLSRAFSVGQEVGHARKANKPIIPLVAKGVKSSELGFLAGITYVQLDTRNPSAAIQALQQQLDKLKQQALLRQQQLQALKDQENRQGIAILALLALLLFFLSKE